MPKRLSEFGVGDGAILKCDDFQQNFQLVLQLVHRYRQTDRQTDRCTIQTNVSASLCQILGAMELKKCISMCQSAPTVVTALSFTAQPTTNL